MSLLQRIKRPLSFLMAVVMLLSSISFSSIGSQLVEEGETNFKKENVVFSGRSLYVFGQNHNSMNFYKSGPGSEAAPTFCIAPGKKLPGGTATRYKKYEAKPGETVPVIGSFERYLPMTIAYEWMIREGDYNDMVRYAVVQVYYWGCVSGHETDWAAQEAAMTKLAGVLRTGTVMTYYQEMKEYILKGMEDYNSGANSSLPDWNGKQLVMKANERNYTLTLDISQNPQLRDTTWNLPDGNWSYQILPDGKSIEFKYNGSTEPKGTVTSGELSGVEKRFYAYIFTPKEGYQEQMGRPDLSYEPESVSFSVKGFVPQNVQPELYRHSEAFRSHYNLDLEKYDAETNQPLEGAVFRVWENFDENQVNKSEYEEGNPDGETGQVYLNRLSPKPEASHIAGEVTTDKNGRGVYRSERLYEYSKTYCMGHPAPSFLEAPEAEYDAQTGDQINEDVIEAVEAENDRLRQQWMAEQEVCEATCDFHVGNEDETNQSSSTEALEAMLLDRDETYERFISLEYEYQLEEKTARTGYIVHGNHKEDAEIESVIVTSAEDGGKIRAGQPIVKGGIVLIEPVNFAEPLRTALRKAYAYPLPSEEDQGLEERRSVVAATEDTGRTIRKKVTVPKAAESEAQASSRPEEAPSTPSTATPSDAVREEVKEAPVEEHPPVDSPSLNDEIISDGTPSNAVEAEEEAGEVEEERFFPATSSEAVEKVEQKQEAVEDLAEEQMVEEYESYEYSVKLSEAASMASEGSLITLPEEEEEQGETGFFQAKPEDKEERADQVTVTLPDFLDDSEDPISQDKYGDKDQFLYTFKVWNHRTEGRIHINKRDLELYREDPDNSYGLVQGEGTLEGAVYGLFAAQDIVHPDGKSGVVYHKDDLTAIATTDRMGDASFLVFTEAPGTRLTADGRVEAPATDASPASLYNGGSIQSSPYGFGTVTYPDLAAENGNLWIGRPLLMGSYYVMEISRSEGYELSVKGINLTDSNRTEGDGAFTMPTTGQAQVIGGLSDYNNMSGDGSWNDFIVESFGTEHGYDVTVTGYPRETTFYRVDIVTKKHTVKEATGSKLQPKTDEKGQPVYQKAKGGEYKKDAQGNPIVAAGAGTIPYGEVLPYGFRTAGSPQGTAVPKDMSKWGEGIDADYLSLQVNDMLKQLGYGNPSPTAPWKEILLTKVTNGEGVQEILDWFVENPFFDCGQVEKVYAKDGGYAVRIRYDYSATQEGVPAVYDVASGALYVRKTAKVKKGDSQEVSYWIRYERGDYRLDARTAFIKEKKEIAEAIQFPEPMEPLIKTLYQPVYETYAPGEILLDSKGNPMPEMERVYTYAEREVEQEEEQLVPVTVQYEEGTGIYTFHEENTVDWQAEQQPRQTIYRAVTKQTSIAYEGQEMPYNQYLVQVKGAGVSAYASFGTLDAGSYVKPVVLTYPGQMEGIQDGGTKENPIQVLQRSIKQSIKITKDISQASYDGVNTYGALHNDPVTVLLDLFTGGNQTQGTKLLNQFKFKLYLKTNLENLYVDDTGTIVSQRVDKEGFSEEVQRIYLPPKEEGARQLLERKPDGSYDYPKFFAAMYAAADGFQPEGAATPGNATPSTAEKSGQSAIRQFALDYFDVKGYKEELLEAASEMDTDLAYQAALERAVREAEDYLKPFKGLDALLAIAWDRDKEGGEDQDATTLQCNTRQGKDDYFNNSILLPYGTYVIVEQTPGNNEKELANRHYRTDYPKELTLPFVPDIHTDGNTGSEEVDDEMGSSYYCYNSTDTPDELMSKYKIRFNEENHVLKAYNEDGSFEVYKYGLTEKERPGGSLSTEQTGYTSQSEAGGSLDGVVYEGYETDHGKIEIKDGVATMTGVNTAIDGKFAPMLVPWSVREPEGKLTPKGEGADFNFRAFAHEDFENKYHSSKLRIEKLDSETGERILQDGAIFKIYAAKREAVKNGAGSVAGSGRVLFGEEIPLYDESQQILQEDGEGNEVGIFKAYSTIREVVVDGTVQSLPVGYIETYKPLGAGAYVLVEIKAPEGYRKSRPVAFEIYADGTYYYEEGEAGWNRKTSERYEYAIPVSGETNKFQTETVSRIEVKDTPSRMKLYKVEDGDSYVGNENGWMEQDRWGNKEPGGGFDRVLTLNDQGDHVRYPVTGTKEQLEARGDVQDITYDQEKKQWVGYGLKSLDSYSEHIVEGTERELRKQAGVKLLYELDGTFSGKGIDFTIPVSGAGLTLYHGVELEKTGENTYQGVSAHWENGRVTSITDTYTGNKKKIAPVGTDTGAAGLTIWDVTEQPGEPVNLYFYDLETIQTEKGEQPGEVKVLDERGNVICYADSVTGMAYVYDDYGRMIAYTADAQGNKEVVHSIPVTEEEGKQRMYGAKQSEDDENGLPIYYRETQLKKKEESWISGNSTDSYGNQEGEGSPHSIDRLPFGAYILEETKVPYDKGYVQSVNMGLVFHDNGREQSYFMQNDFTKAAFSKLDIETKKELQGAEMTLYRAKTDEGGVPLVNPDGSYQKGEVYTSWISGTQYDTGGSLVQNGQKHPEASACPYWLDHIPVGFYVLEETRVPYEKGYVASPPINIDLKERGEVQSFVMEDDFTALEVRKYDRKSQDVLYKDSRAYLTLYHARLDDSGVPVVADGVPQYDESGKIFTFPAATYQDGQKVAATGRVEVNEEGTPFIRYDYDMKAIPGTIQGRYYATEKGNTRFEYLPVGSYVLVETDNPEGYATAAPILITLKDVGHLEEIQYTEMEDAPIHLEIAKVNETGGRVIQGAELAIYPVDDVGMVSKTPLVLHQPTENGAYQEVTAQWVSGLDGRYTKEDGESGIIPPGLKEGDLKPHVVEYIPEGTYILREEKTPYGFLKAKDMSFTVLDTMEPQKVELKDEIPGGILKLIKSDADRPDIKLKDVQFQLVNKTLNQVCETVTTNAKGEAQFKPQPIGGMDSDGNFQPYTYECREVKPAEGYMLTLVPYEFQFQYQDEHTAVVELEYNPSNESNRVREDKLLGDTEQWLEGATLRVERKIKGSEWEPVDEWVTGKQSHYTKDLAAGAYRLIEVKAPDGFKVLAEPIPFTITEGMTEIPHLIMKNDTSIAEIQKADPQGTLLPGARLQLICKETGTVIREWTSEEGEGQKFFGLKEGIYVIHEIEAPKGYEKGEDKEITVTEDSSEAQVFTYENKIRGGGGNRPAPLTDRILFKKTDGGGRGLPGAEFTFYDQSGKRMETSVSDRWGQFWIPRPENGTYTFYETKAPLGYGKNSQIYSFSVNENGVIRGAYEVINKKMEVPVKKMDGVTGEFLSCARLSIRDKDHSEQIIGQGETDQNGDLVFKVPYPGVYLIREEEAPSGYRLTEDVYEVTVNEDGQVSGNTKIYNFKETQPVKTMGRITAVYRVKGRFGKGTYHAGGGKDSSIRTGDSSPLLQEGIIGVLCFAGFIFSIRASLKERRREKKLPGTGGGKGGGRKGKWLLLFVCLLTSMIHFPDSMAVEQTCGETENAFYASDQIIYKDLEGVESVPQRAWITAKDPDTGEEREVALPLVDYTFTSETWRKGFQMEVKMTGYGSDAYLLGDNLVEGKAYSDEYEEEVLALAGLGKDRYHIEGVRWKGEIYEEQGEKCRNLEVFGKKLVRDCIATYAGMVNKEIFKRESAAGLQEGEKMSIGSSGYNRNTLAAILLILLLVIVLAAAVLGIRFYRRRHGGSLLRRIGALLFLSGGICSAAMLINSGLVYERGHRKYAELEEAAYGKKSQTSEEQPFPSIDESWLKTVNPDYRMWILVPGTGIDYPVVQAKDNQYYLTHDFYNEKFIGGSIFLDSSVHPFVTDNTILYGHNMKDGSMFGSLKRYREEAFYLNHPFVRIFYEGKWMDCPVFSCQIRAETDASPCRKDFLDTEWLSYLNEMREASLYPTDYSFTGDERIITCSTCFGSRQRLVVQVAMPDNTKEEVK